MVDEIPVITIDGPSGSGKGTVAGILAQQLGWHLLDSGAIYRALGLAAQRHSIATDDIPALVELARSLDLEFRVIGDNVSIFLEEQDVSVEIRSETCGNQASKIAVIAQIREALLDRQRRFQRPPGLVADGRDMGTVVFPNARCKIFLTASVEERANRRHKQLKEKGISVNLRLLFDEIAERDERDASRKAAPLKAAEDAVMIDTTDLDINQVVQEVLTICCFD